MKKLALRFFAVALCALTVIALLPSPVAAAGTQESTVHAYITGVLRDAPVVTKNPTGETLNIGGSNSFIAKATGATSQQWRFVDTAGKDHSASETKSILKGLRIKGDTSEKCIISNVPAEMNNWKIYCVFKNSSGKTTETKKATIKVRQAKPTVTKSPSAETVDQGAKASFIARADHAESILWYFAKGKTVVKATAAAKKFSGLKVSGATSEKLVLDNIPTSLDGYSVYAVFTNDAGSVESAKATLHVKAKATPTPVAPTATPAGSASQETTPVQTPSQGSSTIATSEDETEDTPVHEHSFSPQWSSDENGHFHVCECGAVSEVIPHEMVTTVVAKATRSTAGIETDTCSVCGYQIERTIPATGSGPSPVLIVVLVVLIILVLGVAGFAGYAYYRQHFGRKKKKSHRKPVIEDEYDDLPDEEYRDEVSDDYSEEDPEEDYPEDGYPEDDYSDEGYLEEDYMENNPEEGAYRDE